MTDLDIPVGGSYRDRANGFVVRAVAPEGSVVVDRARFERLRVFVAEYFGRNLNHPGSRERFFVALEEISPGDLDPLP